MELSIHDTERIRVSTKQGENFIDVNGCHFESAIAVDAYPRFHYIEVRRKKDRLRTFYFKSKRYKKEMDLGWWTDAEVVYSLNEVNKDI